MKCLQLFCLLQAATAFATPDFPSVMQTELMLPRAPDCAVCHRGGVGALGTVTVPFGVTMTKKGVQAYDNAALKAALALTVTEKTDSDGDGISDVAELKAGTDPNLATAVTTDGGQPPVDPDAIRYGCFAQSTPAMAFSNLAMLLAVFALRFRRRPR